MLRLYEEEFETRLRALERDSIECAVFGYTEFSMNHAAAEGDTYDRLQLHAGFWNRVRAALQAATFISLSRIYDSRTDGHRASDLLKYGETHYGVFSLEALRQRKVRHGLPADIAREYVQDAYEMRPDGFRDLKGELAAQQQIFDEKIRPIRHKVYAHAGQINTEEREALFENLPMRTFEKTLVFPLQLHRALWQLYENGREPTLAPAPTLLADVLRAASDKHASTWEHLHATGDAIGFFSWLARHPDVPG